MFLETEGALEETPSFGSMQQLGAKLWERLTKGGSDLLNNLMQNVPSAVAEVTQRMDELTEIMVHGSLVRINGEEQDLVDFDLLEIEDVANLRVAVSEQTDWRKLWETEKNSWVDAVSRIMPSQSSGMNPASSPDGGPAGSLSSLPEDLNSATS